MTRFLVVGLGGFIGAIARYGLSGLVHRHWSSAFPLGTLVVNVLGCLLLGGVLYVAEERAMLSPTLRLFVAIGILGGFTTFSSFSYETVELLKNREMSMALLNVAGSIILGLAALWLGRAGLRMLCA